MEQEQSIVWFNEHFEDKPINQCSREELIAELKRAYITIRGLCSAGEDHKMRKRRKKSEMPFAEALEFARKRLVKAKKEREQTSIQLASLDREIPDLECTILALEQQLRPPQYVHLSEIGQFPVETTVMHYNSKTGETTAPSTQGLPVTVETEDDTLPEVEGVELLPES